MTEIETIEKETDEHVSKSLGVWPLHKRIDLLDKRTAVLQEEFEDRLADLCSDTRSDLRILEDRIDALEQRIDGHVRRMDYLDEKDVDLSTRIAQQKERHGFPGRRARQRLRPPAGLDVRPGRLAGCAGPRPAGPCRRMAVMTKRKRKLYGRGMIRAEHPKLWPGLKAILAEWARQLLGRPRGGGPGVRQDARAAPLCPSARGPRGPDALRLLASGPEALRPEGPMAPRALGGAVTEPELSRYSNSAWIPGPVLDRIIDHLRWVSVACNGSRRFDAEKLADELEEATR